MARGGLGACPLSGGRHFSLWGRDGASLVRERVGFCEGAPAAHEESVWGRNMELQRTFVMPSPEACPGLEVAVYPDFRPVRLMNNGRRNRIVGSFASLKTGQSAPWESHHERRGLEFAEVDPNVRDFRAQPFVMSWREGGKTSSYTPDRIEWRRDGQIWVVEVKERLEELDNADLRKRMERVSSAVEAWGAIFKLQYGEQLKEHPSADFVAAVLYYRHTQITHADWLILDGLSRSKERFTYDSFEAAYETPQLAFAKFSSLLVRRWVSVNDLKPPQAGTVISRVSSEGRCG